MTWGTQLYLSREEKKRYSVTGLKQELSKILDRPGLNRLLFWNTADDGYTGAVTELCRTRNVECWLWFPVLADPLIPAEGARFSENHRNQKGVCSPGCMHQSGEGEEEFSFICPSDSDFQEQTRRHLETLLTQYSFDGTFIDRIRYPSFANGFPLQFSCTCPDCCSAMEMDREALISELESVSAERYRDIWCLGIDDGSLLYEFYSKRKTLITKTAAGLQKISKNLERGFALDLFSPSLAGTVGQDYKALGRLADWIKPMTYAMAWGPAGIPLELDCLYRGLNETFPGLTRPFLMTTLEQLTGHPLAGFWETRHTEGFPFSLVESEWQRINKEENRPACDLIPGIELVRSELFHTKVPPARARDAARVFSSNPQGIVASWNCLDIPEDYFNILDQG